MASRVGGRALGAACCGLTSGGHRNAGTNATLTPANRRMCVLSAVHTRTPTRTDLTNSWGFRRIGHRGKRLAISAGMITLLASSFLLFHQPLRDAYRMLQSF